MDTQKKLIINELLPSPILCEQLELETGDVILHAPGFEDRTLDIANSIIPCESSEGILFDYLPFKEGNKLKEVRERLSGKGLFIADDNIIKYDRFEPGDFEDRLESCLNRLKARQIIIDISSMSKLLILLALNVCLRLKLRLKVLYCEAKKYGPSQDKFNNARKNNEVRQPTLQIYTGVHGVVRVNSLSSVAMQGQPTAAIVFMSFNDNLTQVLLNTVYPSRLFLVNGKPPEHSWREDATSWIHEQVRREWENDNPVIDVDGIKKPKRVASTWDYRETVELLLKLYWDLSATHRILLAPSGSKMQTVGCFLVKALHPDIHIEYPSPEGFLDEYSEEIGKRWIIDFNQIYDLLEKFAEMERQQFLEINE